MEKKVKTKKLSDGTLQVGYHTVQGWVGLTNLHRIRYGHLGWRWKSDNWSGVEKTISDWKIRIQGYVNEDSTL